MAGEELAVTLRALADPTRLRVFDMLLEKEMCVCEIAERLNVSQPLASHHLRELKIAGLVLDRREGNWVHYHLNVEVIGKLQEKLDDLFSRVVQEPEKSSYPCAETKRRLRVPRAATTSSRGRL